jgi:hypothetical protein
MAIIEFGFRPRYQNKSVEDRDTLLSSMSLLGCVWHICNVNNPPRATVDATISFAALPDVLHLFQEQVSSLFYIDGMRNGTTRGYTPAMIPSSLMSPVGIIIIPHHRGGGCCGLVGS